MSNVIEHITRELITLEGEVRSRWCVQTRCRTGRRAPPARESRSARTAVPVVGGVRRAEAVACSEAARARPPRQRRRRTLPAPSRSARRLVLPSPDRAFFERPVLQHQLGNHLLERAGLPAQILDLLRGCGPHRVTSQTLLAGFQKFLRPAVMQVLHDPFAAVQLSNAVLTTQAGQHNADLLFRRKLVARCATDLF